MSILLFANNAATTLASTANLSDTVLNLAAATGALFPSPTAGQSFIATIQSGTQYEIVECTGRTADALTVVRASEGTTAQTWTAGSSVTMRPTAGTMTALEQVERAQASYAPINGPISLSADPADPMHAVRESYLAGRETAIRADMTAAFALKGALVGEVKEYYGLDLPSGFLWAAGQAVSRTTYAELFAALTRELTVTVVSGSPTVTVTSGSLDRLAAGMPISLNGYFAAGTTIVTVGVGSLTLSANALASDSGLALRVCPYGVGNNTTTFNLPDRRGTTAVGRDDMNSTAASRVTTAGSTVNGARLGVVGGSQRAQQHNHALTDPGHWHPVVDPGHEHQLEGGHAPMTFTGGFPLGTYGGGTTPIYYITKVAAATTGISISANTTGISVQNSGDGTSQNMQPSTICNAIIFANV